VGILYLFKLCFKQIFLRKCLQDVQEVEDSCSNTSVIDTPTSKTSLKRSSDSINSVAVEHGEAGQASVTKPNRVVRVKIEPTDTKAV
jgi:hypothetical protein